MAGAALARRRRDHSPARPHLVGPAHRWRRARHDTGLQLAALRIWRAGLGLLVRGAHVRRQADDVPSRIVDAAAILATVLLVVFQVRHYVTGGDPYGTGSPLMTAGLQVSLLLAVLIGLERIRLKTGSIVQDVGAQLLAAGLLLAIAFGLGVNANPLFTGEAVGGRFVISSCSDTASRRC